MSAKCTDPKCNCRSFARGGLIADVCGKCHHWNWQHGEKISLQDSIAKGVEGREVGMARVDAAADEDWKAHADTALKEVCETRGEFTTDRVWSVMGYALDEDEKEVTPTAMGPVMRRGQSKGWCAPSGRTKPSARSTNHRRQITVWKSLIVNGPQSHSPCPTCGGTGKVNT